MPGTLFINACVRRGTSRTDRLARALLSALGGGFEEVVLETSDVRGLDSASLERRDSSIASGDFSDPMFDRAKRFMDADTVVVAAPFWESCFPATLKAYLEEVSVPRLVYRYNEHGIPEGNCRCTLYYVTTRGGPVPDEGDLGLMVIRETCRVFGITDVRVLSASGLDIVGNDVEAILSEAIERIPGLVSPTA